MMMGRTPISRRTFLKGIGAGGAVIRVGMPALEAMFNSNGTAYAASANGKASAIPTRFVLWFNGNGIPEKYWVPRTNRQRLRVHPLSEAADRRSAMTFTSSPDWTARRRVSRGPATATIRR